MGGVGEPTDHLFVSYKVRVTDVESELPFFFDRGGVFILQGPGETVGFITVHRIVIQSNAVSEDFVASLATRKDIRHWGYTPLP